MDPGAITTKLGFNEPEPTTAEVYDRTDDVVENCKVVEIVDVAGIGICVMVCLVAPQCV